MGIHNLSNSFQSWRLKALTIAQCLLAPLRFIVLSVLRRSSVIIVYRAGKAIGDHVCLTGVLRQIHQRYGLRALVFSSYPELFLRLKSVRGCYSPKQFGKYGWPVVKLLFRLFEGAGVYHYRSFRDGLEHPEFLAHQPDCPPLAILHAEHWRFDLDPNDITPEIKISEEEAITFQEQLGLPPEFAVVATSEKTSFTPNKSWPIEHFQTVVSSTPGATWVQVGLISDTRIKGCIDYRGRTLSLRELAFLISRASYVLSCEGLLNHLAAAFAVDSFVICSGFSPMGLAAYPTSILISRVPQVSCAPCWLRSACPVPGKPCTGDIPPLQVVDAINSRKLELTHASQRKHDEELVRQ